MPKVGSKASANAKKAAPELTPAEVKSAERAVKSRLTPEKETPVPSAVSAPALPQDEEGEPLELVYDKVESLEYSTTSSHGPVTPQDMRVILNWKTEEQYQQEMMEKHPESKPEAWLYYDDFHCLDTNGKKVRCFNNANNRPFEREPWCGELIHTILQGQWAGPLTYPGETVNGEAIRLSKYGRVLSGQHQGTALILAQELLEKSRQALYYDPADIESEKYKFWYGHEHVVIETFITTGISEDPRIIRTVDYVKPRSEADMLYTMELFRSNSPIQRREMTRMLAAAIDMLWTRTDAKGYRTHPEIVGFLERHERLLECVQHIFVENQPMTVGSKKRQDGETIEQHKERMEQQAAMGGRRLSKHHLSPGSCAALLFLMGSSATGEAESDAYRNMKPPTEKDLDWSLWDKAKEFWTLLAGDRKFAPVRTALNRLVESEAGSEENQGLGGRSEEKLAILAQAWSAFKDHPSDQEDNPPFPFEVDPETNQIISDDLEPPDGALSLCYTSNDDQGDPLPEGKIKLINVADFLGIDCPASSKSAAQAKAAPAPAPPTPEEIELGKQEALKRREEEEDARKARPRSIKRK